MTIQLKQKSFNSQRKVYEYQIINPDNINIGFIQLRLLPSKSLEMPAGFESHIYYEIKPEYRGKGYATEALEAVVKKAKRSGIRSLILTVSKDNLASIKVIEKCAGKKIEEGRTTKGQSVFKYQLKT